MVPKFSDSTNLKVPGIALQWSLSKTRKIFLRSGAIAPIRVPLRRVNGQHWHGCLPPSLPLSVRIFKTLTSYATGPCSDASNMLPRHKGSAKKTSRGTTYAIYTSEIVCICLYMYIRFVVRYHLHMLTYVTHSCFHRHRQIIRPSRGRIDSRMMESFPQLGFRFNLAINHYLLSRIHHCSDCNVFSWKSQPMAGQ